MDNKIRLLFVEDNEDDALLMENELRRNLPDFYHRQVDSLEALESSLTESDWDIILSDYNLNGFNIHSVIDLLKHKRLDIPLIVVSGAVGEDVAVELMKLGARDYIMKGKWYRLAPAIKRELNEVRLREKKRQSDKAFQNSEKRFKTLTDLAPVGIYQANVSGDFVYVNDRWTKM
ncbi:MAG: response regulator, partial [Spirochaetota bacterium]|nr:response regulator [Spirochaetota bacterium]